MISPDKFMFFTTRLESGHVNRFHEAYQASQGANSRGELALSNFNAWRCAATCLYNIQHLLFLGIEPTAKFARDPKVNARHNEVRALTTKNRFGMR